jgi:NADH-quinone oxidoreductase subunit H
VAAQQGGFAHWTVFTNPLATIAAMLAFVAMMHRSPFDLHLAPQEIPVGPPTEFHSSYLFMMSFNRAFFGSAKLVLFANLFFGGATSIPELIVKTFLIMFWTVFIGAVFPRFRLEQSVRWLIRVPALIGLLAVALQIF